MNDALEQRTSTLGFVSIALAFAGIVVSVYFALNSGISFQGGTVYVVTLYPYGGQGNVSLGYIGMSLCLLGLVFGVEGYRRPASQKLFAIVGALMNATILFAMAAVFGMYMYWFH